VGANDRFSELVMTAGVELGPSLIPNADVARNVFYPRTDKSQIGQFRPFAVATEISGERPFGPTRRSSGGGGCVGRQQERRGR